MNKDVIYIDTEDDITAIIGKVKSAGTKIVALVPPKRIGVLQSAVNLKLLHKAAIDIDKRIVLITNDHSLVALAAGIKVPVAKNLQSRPEIPHVEPPQASEDEVINGQELPVGEVAASLTPSPSGEGTSAVDAIDKKVEPGTAATPGAKPPGKSGQPAKAGGLKDKLKIPNFNIFRKRLFIFGGLAILLVAFLVWAFVFAPRATVTIAAKTQNVNVDRTLTLDPGLQQSQPEAFLLKPETQQLKKAVAVEFTATGSKEIGEKAKGSMTVRNCDNSDGFTLPAGTLFTSSNGRVFEADKAVAVPKFSGSANSCSLSGDSAGTANVNVTAVDIGEDYNISSQGYTFNGSIPGSVDAVGSKMSGGTKQTVTVVSQADVDKAQQELGPPDIEAAKSELKTQFGNEWLVIEESFAANQGKPSVAPNVGEQATTGKLTLETTFSFVAVAREDIKTILTSAVDDVLESEPEQQMYSLGENNVIFRTFRQEANIFVARMAATGSIGPKINSEELAQQLAGKRFGEIQAIVNQIPGTENVDIQLSPFWVTTAPAADKIEVKFSVAPSGGSEDE